MRTRLILSLFFGVLLISIACQNNANTKKLTLDDATQKLYLEKGKLIAGKSFATLAGNLQKSLAEGGVTNAIQYCNLAALPLIDSLSEAHQANIRRTSLKVRNPQDTPSELEKEILEQYHVQEETGKELQAKVQQIDDKTISFFAPIKVNAFCLQCHGKIQETLTIENHKLIKQFYPEDKAFGYVAGDLRGMWHIQFVK